MSQSPIQTAIQQICQEKNITEEAVLRAIELALAAAYRKDFGNKMQNIVTNFDVKTGGVKVFDIKTVVEDLPPEELAAVEAEAKKAEALAATKERDNIRAFIAMEDDESVRKFNPKTEIQISDAKKINKKYKVGEEIVTPLEVPGEFGRMAAQTAKQVIIQKIREVERENVFTEYKSLEHQVVNGAIQRREGRNILVDLDHAVALMPPEEQIPTERYNVGNRMKFYLLLVEQSSRGPQLIVSRAHSEIVRKIFELEIPEIANNTIEIKSIAREAGHRSKVAISSNDENIDPIGSCVGQRGARIQTIIHELSGEKVDIILWDDDMVRFITNALSPAKINHVELRDAGPEKVALVKVKEDQLSLAIGRAGQNVRLASKLTGWKIDIIPEDNKGAEAGAGKEEASIEEAAAEALAVNGDDTGVAETEAKPDEKKVKKTKKVKTKKTED